MFALLYLWQLCRMEKDCFHQSSTFSPLQSMSMNNSTAQVESLSFQLQCGSVTWESIRWRMDNNTKAKVLWDGLIWCPLFLIHHKKKSGKGLTNQTRKAELCFLKYDQNILDIVSLICWIFIWKKRVKNKTGVLTFNAVKVLNALAEKVVRNPGVNSFKGLGDTFYS